MLSLSSSSSAPANREADGYSIEPPFLPSEHAFDFCNEIRAAYETQNPVLGAKVNAYNTHGWRRVLENALAESSRQIDQLPPGMQSIVRSSVATLTAALALNTEQLNARMRELFQQLIAVPGTGAPLSAATLTPVEECTAITKVVAARIFDTARNGDAFNPKLALGGSDQAVLTVVPNASSSIRNYNFHQLLVDKMKTEAKDAMKLTSEQQSRVSVHTYNADSLIIQALPQQMHDVAKIRTLMRKAGEQVQAQLMAPEVRNQPAVVVAEPEAQRETETVAEPKRSSVKSRRRSIARELRALQNTGHSIIIESRLRSGSKKS